MYESGECALEIKLVDLLPKRSNSREKVMEQIHLGLSAHPGTKKIDSMHLYSPLGCKLYPQVIEQPGYYLNEAELDLRPKAFTEPVIRYSKRSVMVIDLGCGSNPEKTVPLIGRLLDAGASPEVVACDINPESNSEYLDSVRQKFGSAVRLTAVTGEYRPILRWLALQHHQPKVLLFQGSNIGNKPHKAAAKLLRGMRQAIGSDGLLLIGYDLKADGTHKTNADILLAYNDEAGKTSDFNLALIPYLINDYGLEGLDPELFKHVHAYDPFEGCATSGLLVLEDQLTGITIRGCRYPIRFSKGEILETEVSMKYAQLQIQTLITGAGFSPVRIDHNYRYAIGCYKPD